MEDTRLYMVNLTEKDEAWEYILMYHKSTHGNSLPYVCVCVCLNCNINGYDSWAQVWQQQQRPVQQVCDCVGLQDVQKQVQLTNTDYEVAVGGTLPSWDYNFSLRLLLTNDYYFHY